MKLPDSNKKKIVQAAAVALPLLLVTGSWIAFKHKHGQQAQQGSVSQNTTLSQAPQTLSGNTSGNASQGLASNPESSSSSGLASGSNASAQAQNAAPAAHEQGSPSFFQRLFHGGVANWANSVSHTNSPSALTGSGVAPEQRSVASAGTSTGVSAGAPAGAAVTGQAVDAKSVATTALQEAAKPAEVIETPATMKDGCFTVSFTHKSLATHASDDECSHHRNMLKLPRADVHSSSVCIRVNGTPVRHEAVADHPDEFVIGAVAGPKDTITARFCVGKSKCAEACPYPKQEVAKKDEFLEAISGGSNEDTGVAQWEADDAKKNDEVNQALDGDLKKAVEEHELAAQRTSAKNSKLEIFKDWLGSDMDLACGTHLAGKAGENTRAPASVQVAQKSANGSKQ